MNGQATALDPTRFGTYGGRFVSELLQPAVIELEQAVDRILPTARFQDQLETELTRWGGRPTPLTAAPRFSALTGLEVWLKREDLLHGGAHKTNNAIGQGLLARAMGKRRLIAETGAGQHGVATAMVAARLGLEATVYMGARDAERQATNVERMELFGARVVRVEAGAGTLKGAINEALRDWAATLDHSHYLLGTVCGPAPYPRMVGELQAVLGREAARQWNESVGGLPAAAVACVGGGSNAIGLFRGFVDRPQVRLIGVEPGGHGAGAGEHGATVSRGTPGLLHGARTLVLQDDDGQIGESSSIAAGLDYPGVGPEHAFLRDTGRAEYATVSDEQALEAFALLAQREGILPALESSHALAFVRRAVEDGRLDAGQRVVVCLSGRGDKDLSTYRGRRA